MAYEEMTVGSLSRACLPRHFDTQKIKTHISA